MSIIVLGRSGQVASHLRSLLPEAKFWGRSQLDISDTARLETALLDAAPSAIINAAAYTAVDRAELEPEAAWRINADAPAAAARVSRALDIPLIHISTDYVFDGRGRAPYTERDAVNPLNTYGRTKLAGELAVASLCSKYWILRTSWLFSEYGGNFVKTMLEAAKAGNALRVVADQSGRPTYAGQLAQLIANMTVSEANRERYPPGIYHAVGGPVVSWHGFAEAIFSTAREFGLIQGWPRLNPITSAEYPTAAIRPRAAILEPSPVFTTDPALKLDWGAGLRMALEHLPNQ
jgi:dTDP-4-dehydrorhamnose reductase